MPIMICIRDKDFCYISNRHERQTQQMDKLKEKMKNIHGKFFISDIRGNSDTQPHFSIHAKSNTQVYKNCLRNARRSMQSNLCKNIIFCMVVVNHERSCLESIFKNSHRLIRDL